MKVKHHSMQTIGLMSGLIAVAMTFHLCHAAYADEWASSLKVGDQAPPIKLDKLLGAPDGTDLSWKALKGKAAVLEFWSINCGPCVAAIAHLNTLAEVYKDKPIIFVSITHDKEPDLDKFLKKRPIKTWIGIDFDRSTHKAYGAKGIPRTVLIDKIGKIAAITGPFFLERKNIDELLAAKKVSIGTGGNISYLVPGRPPWVVTSGPNTLFHIEIRPSSNELSTQQVWRNGKMSGIGIDLKPLIAEAYDARSTRIIYECSLSENRYDVVVAMPEGKEQFFKPILQQVLEATFDLKAYHRNRTVGVYLLRINKDNADKIKPSNFEEGCSFRSSRHKIQAIYQQMWAIVYNLERPLGRPLIDETGLKGNYDIVFEWKEGDPESLKQNLLEKYGLELVPAERPIEMLIVKKDDSTKQPARLPGK